MWWNPWLLRVEQGEPTRSVGSTYPIPVTMGVIHRQGMIHGTPLTLGGSWGWLISHDSCGLKMGGYRLITILVPLFLAILKMEHDELWWTHGFRGYTRYIKHWTELDSSKLSKLTKISQSFAQFTVSGLIFFPTGFHAAHHGPGSRAILESCSGYDIATLPWNIMIRNRWISY